MRSTWAAQRAQNHDPRLWQPPQRGGKKRSRIPSLSCRSQGRLAFSGNRVPVCAITIYSSSQGPDRAAASPSGETCGAQKPPSAVSYVSVFPRPFYHASGSGATPDARPLRQRERAQGADLSWLMMLPMAGSTNRYTAITTMTIRTNTNAYSTRLLPPSFDPCCIFIISPRGVLSSSRTIAYYQSLGHRATVGCSDSRCGPG